VRQDEWGGGGKKNQGGKRKQPKKSKGLGKSGTTGYSSWGGREEGDPAWGNSKGRNGSRQNQSVSGEDKNSVDPAGRGRDEEAREREKTELGPTDVGKAGERGKEKESGGGERRALEKRSVRRLGESKAGTNNKGGSGGNVGKHEAGLNEPRKKGEHRKQTERNSTKGTIEMSGNADKKILFGEGGAGMHP